MIKKLTKLGLTFLISGTLVICSCSKDSDKDDVINNQNPTNNPTNEEPTPSKPFFIKGKFNDKWKISQTGLTIYTQVGEAISGSTGYGSSDHATLDINYENGKFTEQNIPNLQGDTIMFETTSVFSAQLWWREDGKGYTSLNVPNAGSYLYISEVKPHSTYQGFKAYTMTGTMNCVLEDDGGKSINVTNASFKVLVTEERW